MAQARKKKDESEEALSVQESAPQELAAEEAPAEREAAAEAEEAHAEPKAPARPPKARPKAEARPKKKADAKPKPARRKPAERKAIVRLPKRERARGARKELRGTVVSSAMDKTIVVRIDTVKPHPRYKKVVRRSAKFHAHDEDNVAKPGDIVRIVEARPLSKTKRWRLAEVLEEAR